MKAFKNVKIFAISGALIFGIALASYVTLKRAKERDLAEHTKTVVVQAERGDTGAETELGHLYYHGLGVVSDYSQAVNWFRKAADKGNAKAQYSLGYMYWFGQGVPVDWAEAVQWFRKAADQCDERAESALGSSYFHGQGVEQDRGTAAGWYRKAADQGFAEAQYDLGYMLYYGQGVAQDRTEANRLFHQAAAQGNEKARRVLGTERRGWTIWNEAQLVLSFGGGTLLLVGSRASVKGRRNHNARATALAGVFSLAFGGLDLLTHFDKVIVPLSSAVTALMFTRDLVGGASLAMLFIVVLAHRSAKMVLVISCAQFIAYDLVVFARYGMFHHAPTIRIILFGCAWFLGMAITSAILLSIEHRRSGDNQNGSGGQAAPETVAG